MKAEIVAEDEKEQGRRALCLTLATPSAMRLRRRLGFGGALLHGEAVGAGMALGVPILRQPSASAPVRTPRVPAAAIAAAGLPTKLSDVRPEPFPADRLIAHMATGQEGGRRPGSPSSSRAPSAMRLWPKASNRIS